MNIGGHGPLCFYHIAYISSFEMIRILMLFGKNYKNYYYAMSGYDVVIDYSEKFLALISKKVANHQLLKIV